MRTLINIGTLLGRLQSIQLSEVLCVVIIFAGLFGPSPCVMLVPYGFGDFFGLLSTSGFILLIALLVVRWRKSSRVDDNHQQSVSGTDTLNAAG